MSHFLIYIVMPPYPLAPRSERSVYALLLFGTRSRVQSPTWLLTTFNEIVCNDLTGISTRATEMVWSLQIPRQCIYCGLKITTAWLTGVIAKGSPRPLNYTGVYSESPNDNKTRWLSWAADCPYSWEFWINAKTLYIAHMWIFVPLSPIDIIACIFANDLIFNSQPQPSTQQSHAHANKYSAEERRQLHFN